MSALPWSAAEARKLLARAPWIHLAGATAEGPLIRVLHGALVGDRLVFHGQVSGEKNGLIGQPVVASAHEVLARIPSHWIDPRRACPATTWYRSAQAYGTLRRIEGAAARAEAMAALMASHQPEGGFEAIDAASPLYRKALDALTLVELPLSRIEGRLKGGEGRAPRYLAKVIEGLWRRGESGDAEAIEHVRAHTPAVPLPAAFEAPAGVTLHACGNPEDVPAVVALLADQYWNVGVDPARIARAHHQAPVWLVARAGGAVVATARAISDHGKHAWIYDVVVDPAWRGKGLGRALMGLVLDHPALRAARTVRLGTRTPGFYAPLGFAPPPVSDVVTLARVS